MVRFERCERRCLHKATSACCGGGVSPENGRAGVATSEQAPSHCCCLSPTTDMIVAGRNEAAAMVAEPLKENWHMASHMRCFPPGSSML